MDRRSLSVNIIVLFGTISLTSSQTNETSVISNTDDLPTISTSWTDETLAHVALIHFINDVVTETTKLGYKLFVLLPSFLTEEHVPQTQTDDYQLMEITGKHSQRPRLIAGTVSEGAMPTPCAVFVNFSLPRFSQAMSSAVGTDQNIAPRLIIFVGREFTPDGLLAAKAPFLVEDQLKPLTTLLFVDFVVPNGNNSDDDTTARGQTESDVDSFFAHRAFDDIYKVALATVEFGTYSTASLVDNSTTESPIDPTEMTLGFVLRKKCKFCNNGFPGWRLDNEWSMMGASDELNNSKDSYGRFKKPMDLTFSEDRNLKRRKIVMITDDFPPYTSFKPGPNGTQVLSAENICSQVNNRMKNNSLSFSWLDTKILELTFFFYVSVKFHGTLNVLGLSKFYDILRHN